MTLIKAQLGRGAAHLTTGAPLTDAVQVAYSNDFGPQATLRVPDHWDRARIDLEVHRFIARGLLAAGGAHDGLADWRFVKDGWTPAMLPIARNYVRTLYVAGDTYPLMGMTEAVQVRGHDGRDLDVGHVDTWVDAAHSWFAGATLVQGGRGADSQVHGTHTAATICGSHGILRALRHLFTFNALPGGSGAEDLIAQGIDWCVDQGARIVSMSLGSPQASRLIDQANARAIARGVLVVSAAGNSGGATNPAGSPARSSTWAVLACDRNLHRASFSDGWNWNTPNRLYGIGVDVVSAFPGEQSGPASGTSMATPHVAGALGLLVDGGVSQLTAQEV